MTLEVDQLIDYHDASRAPGVLTDINTPGVHGKGSAHYTKGTCSRPRPMDRSSGCTGCATDFAFVPQQQMSAALYALWQVFARIESELWELFYEGAPYWIKDGKRVTKEQVSKWPGGDALRYQHRNHVHVALRPGRTISIPATVPSLPAPVPAVIGPIEEHGGDMKRQQFETASLDAQGNGYIDTTIPYDKLVNIIPLGPSPDRDGYGWPNWYWSMNNTNGQARIEIEGGTPGKPVGFIAWFLD